MPATCCLGRGKVHRQLTAIRRIVGSCRSCPAMKELLLGYESILIMVLFCYILDFFRHHGCTSLPKNFSNKVIVAFLGNRVICGLSCNLRVIVALLILKLFRAIINKIQTSE